MMSDEEKIEREKEFVNKEKLIDQMIDIKIEKE